MKYIMSGSCGLIGESLKKRLDKKGNRCVMQIDQRLGSNVLSLDSIKLTPSTQQTDIFFHLAAHCKINEGTNFPLLPHINNANGTFAALEFCRLNGIKKFVYMSSSRTLSPEENPYTASKKYGEALCEAYKQCYGINFIIIRPSTVYGEHHDLTTRLLTIWIINALKDMPLLLYGDTKKTLDFTHVDDFVDGIEILINKWDKAKNQAYDICGNDCRRLTEVASIIEKEIGRYVEVKYTQAAIAQPQQVKIDISDMKKLGYNPKIRLEEGIKRLVKFYETEGRKWIDD